MCIRDSIYEEKVKTTKLVRKQENYFDCVSIITKGKVKETITSNDKKLLEQSQKIIQELDNMLIIISDSIKYRARELYNSKFEKKDTNICMPPIRYDKGLDSLRIAFYKKADNSLVYSQAIPFPIEVREKRYKFSTQTFISNLGSEAYSLFTDPGGQTILVNEEASRIEFGVTTGINYFFSNRCFFGGGVGIAYVDRVRPRLLANVGVALGHEKRFFISLGGIMGIREVKSNLFDNSDFVIPSTTTSAVVNNVGIGYSIGAGYFL